MKDVHKGFTLAQALIIVVIVGIIGSLGLFIWKKQSNQTNDNFISTTNQNTASDNYTDCHTVKDEVNMADGVNDNQYQWQTVEHTKVLLSEWNVTISLPKDLVGKAVCRYNNNNYEFSTLAVINDVECVEYYLDEEISSEGVQIMKFSEKTPAEEQIGTGTKGTLDEYYKSNKAKDGNYFTNPNDGRTYYKVGDSFYVAFGDAKGVLEKYKTSRKEACKNEKPNFTQPFVDAMVTIKQS